MVVFRPIMLIRLERFDSEAKVPAYHDNSSSR